MKKTVMMWTVESDAADKPDMLNYVVRRSDRPLTDQNQNQLSPVAVSVGLRKRRRGERDSLYSFCVLLRSYTLASTVTSSGHSGPGILKHLF